MMTSSTLAEPTNTSTLGRLPVAMAMTPFFVLFMVRALSPADPLFMAIGILLGATTAAVVAGVRAAGWGYLVFPVSFFTTPAVVDTSFNLSAVDSTAWRWHAIASLFSLGLSTVAALTVGRRGAHLPLLSPMAPLGALLGVGFLTVTPVLAHHPGFGGELNDAELAALPTIDLLNYEYGPSVVSLDADGGVQQFLLVNPSELPHTVTIDAIELEVWVPAGRSAVLEIDPATLPSALAFYCSVGDHEARGMSGLLEVE